VPRPHRASHTGRPLSQRSLTVPPLRRPSRIEHLRQSGRRSPCDDRWLCDFAGELREARLCCCFSRGRFWSSVLGHTWVPISATRSDVQLRSGQDVVKDAEVQ
jgi:hypothetical protein